MPLNYRENFPRAPRAKQVTAGVTTGETQVTDPKTLPPENYLVCALVQRFRVTFTCTAYRIFTFTARPPAQPYFYSYRFLHTAV